MKIKLILMIRLLATITLLLILPFINSAQTVNTIVVDIVAKKICADLNEIKNIENLSNIEAKEIINNAIYEHKEAWDRELDKIVNSRSEKTTIFHYLLRHRLLLECDKYWIVDNKIDKNLKGSSLNKVSHLIVKKFIIDIESGVSTKALMKYFSPEFNQDTLRENLIVLQKELNQYSRNSGLFFRSGYPNFAVNVFDIITGDSNVFIKFLFDSSSIGLIHKWAFFDKEENIKQNKIDEQEIENIPMPPMN